MSEYQMSEYQVSEYQMSEYRRTNAVLARDAATKNTLCSVARSARQE